MFCSSTAGELTTQTKSTGYAYPNSGSRKDLGFGLPGCGRGVIVPEADGATLLESDIYTYPAVQVAGRRKLTNFYEPKTQS